MEGLAEIEELFLSKIKPYEDRIQNLENSERAKEAEIEKLKQSIGNLNKVIDQ
jgi:cell division protein FtsB